MTIFLLDGWQKRSCVYLRGIFHWDAQKTAQSRSAAAWPNLASHFTIQNRQSLRTQADTHYDYTDDTQYTKVTRRFNSHNEQRSQEQTNK